MLMIVQKLLEISMRLDKSSRKSLRALGKALGVFPVQYSKFLEKRLFSGAWDPAKKYRRHSRKRRSASRTKKANRRHPI